MTEAQPRYGKRTRASNQHGVANDNLIAVITETLGVCRDLSDRGCRLLSAHCQLPGVFDPRVVIDPPPHRAMLFGSSMIRRPHTETLVTRVGSVQVEWTQPRRAS